MVTWGPVGQPGGQGASQGNLGGQGDWKPAGGVGGGVSGPARGSKGPAKINI